MKKNLPLIISNCCASKKVLPLCMAFVLSITLFAQTANSWKANFEIPKVFIENKSQFDGRNNLRGSKILFVGENASRQILFTKTGLTYRLDKKEILKTDDKEEQKREIEAAENNENLQYRQAEAHEAQEHRGKITLETAFVQMQWLNSNPAVEVEASQPVSNYFNYSVNGKSVDHVTGYQKLVYKNLYPNIDVEYVFNPKDGIEYSFILHPGADASQIKMQYSDVSNIHFDGKQNLHFPTELGDIIEHAPVSTYQGAGNSFIPTHAVLTGKTVSFSLGNYNRSETVIIDPWVQTPSFNTGWQCVWECQKDGAGNAYLIGGVMPMQLLKYNSTGTLQWTYSTPYDTSNVWLGTFATDFAGNSYVTAGSLAQIEKINTGGALVWNNSTVAGIFSLTEFWTISFNCDQTKLVIGGTGGSFFPTPYIYQVDMNSGNVTSSVAITAGSITLPQEVRAITACGNGKYYFLTHDSIGYINQNFGICANPAQAKYYIDNNYHLSYKCENFRVNNTGICAMRAFGGFVYVNRGDTIEKRVFSTGVVVAAAPIPGGVFVSQSFLGTTASYVGNSGIDIDTCGNIYVGSQNKVVQFNTSLAQTGTYTTAFNVYDVQVSYGGVMLACGSTGNSGSGARSGSIQSFNVNACAPIPITCCDASMCQAGPFCSYDSTITTLTASTLGGTWSGAGITNTSTGTFNPSVAGPGFHTIIHSIACGSDSIIIEVKLCAPLTACRENNGDITAHNGTAPYTWYKQVSQQNCSACIIGCVFPPGCATTSNVWQSFTTGTTITPPSFPLEVVDVFGNELIIDSLAALQPCNACGLVATAAGTPTTCGSNNGSATTNVTAGTGPYTYLWSNNSTAQTISNVPSGTYTVTVSGSGGCSITASATVSPSAAVALAPIPTATTCGVSNGSAAANVTAGTGPYSYLWSNNITTATISNVAAGTYTVSVTGAGNCTATGSANIATSTGASINTSTTNATCSLGGSATANIVTGNAPYTYLWSNNATTASISNVAGGTYTVTVTASGCTATASATIGAAGGAVALQPGFSNANCGNNNGMVSVSVTSGNAPFTYLWSNNATTDTVNNLGAGTYTVTVTGAGNCTATITEVVTSTAAVTLSASGTNAGCTTTGSATVTVNTGTSPYTYIWSNNGTTATISNLSAGTYTVTVTGAGGCTATATTTITAPGGVSLTTTSTATTCGASTGSATVAATGGSNYTYSWSNNGTTATIANVGAGTYTVTVTANGGCSATASVAVTGSGTGSTTLTTDKTIMCSDDSAHVCAPTGYATYLWNTGQTTPCIYVHSAGNYYATVTDGSGCTYISNHQSISVHPQPPVSISVNGDTLTVYNAVTIQWYLNGNAISGATSHVLIAQQTGDYSVAVTDSNGCLTTSSKTTVAVGIQDINADGRISVYPNPLAQGSWNLSVTDEWIGSNCEVYDAEGRLIYKAQIRNRVSEISLKVASGIYMMRVSSEKNSVTLKLIKL